MPGHRQLNPRAFTAGNRSALKHGIRSFQTRGASALPDDLRLQMDELRDALISQYGGLDEITPARAELIRSFVHARMVRDMAIGELVHQARQAQAVDVPARLNNKAGQDAAKFALNAIATIERVARTLGLERRQKRAQTLADIIDAAPEVQ